MMVCLKIKILMIIFPPSPPPLANTSKGLHAFNLEKNILRTAEPLYSLVMLCPYRGNSFFLFHTSF